MMEAIPEIRTKTENTLRICQELKNENISQWAVINKNRSNIAKIVGIGLGIYIILGGIVLFL
jgi:hypothetical protein